MASNKEQYINDGKVLIDFYHNNEGDIIWWTESGEIVDGSFYVDCGMHLFSFDQEKIYNLFEDYPHNMTDAEVKIFDSENPFWADFFKDRKR